MTSDNSKKAFATRFLDKHPDVRSTVIKSAGFSSWKSQFPVINVDGVKFYLSGGPAKTNNTMNPGADQLHEEDELILQWARTNQLISEDEVRRFE